MEKVISFAVKFNESSFPKITYDSVGPVQMRFLRLLSGTARQSFTYTCINSVAWYDTRARNYHKSIKFLGDNDDEFSIARNKPKVALDGCRVRILMILNGGEVRTSYFNDFF